MIVIYLATIFTVHLYVNVHLLKVRRPVFSLWLWVDLLKFTTD